MKPVDIVDLTTVDYSIQTLEDIVDFEKKEDDTPKKRPREVAIKKESPSSAEDDEAEEAGSDEDEEEERLTRDFEKRSQGGTTHVDLCGGEDADHDEIVNRHKAQRFDEDDDVEEPATTSSASTTPYSDNSHLKRSIGRTPHPVAIVTEKKKKEKKGKGRF